MRDRSIRVATDGEIDVRQIRRIPEESLTHWPNVDGGGHEKSGVERRKYPQGPAGVKTPQGFVPGSSSDFRFVAILQQNAGDQESAEREEKSYACLANARIKIRSRKKMLP